MKTLYIKIDDELLKNYYIPRINEHNIKNSCPDSGFDICLPDNIYEIKDNKIFVDYKISCVMYENNKPIPFYLYPRSSISKTCLRLANNVGIIDSGYRGDICAYFDVLDNSNLEYKQRLVQICSSTLEPFQIILLDNVEFFETTTRGNNGFGSSGK